MEGFLIRAHRIEFEIQSVMLLLHGYLSLLVYIHTLHIVTECDVPSPPFPVGQCFDAHTDRPTPGLEYVLGTDSQPERFDTIVMANLGYFQLKASPGAWTLRLREGRSAEIYSIVR